MDVPNVSPAMQVPAVGNGCQEAGEAQAEGGFETVLQQVISSQEAPEPAAAESAEEEVEVGGELLEPEQMPEEAPEEAVVEAPGEAPEEAAALVPVQVGPTEGGASTVEVEGILAGLAAAPAGEVAGVEPAPATELVPEARETLNGGAAGIQVPEEDVQVSNIPPAPSEAGGSERPSVVTGQDAVDPESTSVVTGQDADVDGKATEQQVTQPVEGTARANPDVEFAQPRAEVVPNQEVASAREGGEAAEPAAAEEGRKETGPDAVKVLETPDRGEAGGEAREAPAVSTKGEEERGAAPEAGRAKEVQQARPDGAPEVARPAEAEVQAPVEPAEARTELSQPKVPAAAGSPEAPLAGTAPAEEAGASRQPEAPARSAEALPNREAVVDQVVRAARFNAAKGVSRFELRLEPPSLGRVNVVLDLKDGGLSVSFRAENAAVRDLLRSSMPQLRETLAAQGANVDGLGVESSWREAGEGSGAGGDSNSGPQTRGAAEAEAQEGAEVPLAVPVEFRTDGGSVDYLA